MKETEKELMEEKLSDMLSYIGDDPCREGLQETPTRIIKSWGTLFSGYGIDPLSHFKVFEDGVCDEIIVLKNIEFYSTCEHHFLPFFGTVTVGYLPYKKIIGLSKIARIVEVFARRLQIQEVMGTQIADCLNDNLEARGVIVLVKAQHLCMLARGVAKQKGEMLTSAVRGIFLTQPSAKSEFFEMIRS